MIDTKYYGVDEIAERLNLSMTMVRRLFRNRPGVLRIGDRAKPGKRAYLTLRIPQSLVEQWIEENSVPESPRRKGRPNEGGLMATVSWSKLRMQRNGKGEIQ